MSVKSMSAAAARTAAVLGASLALWAAMATPAQADISQYTVLHLDQIPVAPYQIAAESLFCPPGTKALSGGELNSAPGTVILNNSHVTDGNASGWRTGVRNMTGVPQTFTVYAICASVPAFIPIADTQLDVLPFRSNFAVQFCPDGFNAVGGGGFVSSPHGDTYYINSSIPVGNGWGTEIDNDTAETVQQYVYATCGAGIANHQIVGTGHVVLGPHEYKRLSVKCPSGTLVLGGGAHSIGDRAVITDSYPSAIDVWTTYILNRSSENEEFRAVAVCGR